ncbi:hypothetical protein [Hymenobacter negativus]|uniref:Uncharacterized protein n=1 Tax=Hymenobacter negativus TaxID=2795026 RepID=A0ABS3QAR0_9BACT|nr:hypothetical protein [Hymenobacter negativus]MBO2008281.1 hypothetical protein [Hymenobacter negativus]
MPDSRWFYLLLAAATGLQTSVRAQQMNYQPSRAILAQWQQDPEWSNYQNYAVQFSQIGDYVHTLAAQSAYEKGRKQSDTNIKFDPAYFARFHAVDAHRELLKRTANRQLVILNEAHYQPLNRVFTRSLVAGLYRQGFRYLCLEDLANGPGTDSGLNQRKYPVIGTGYYVIEPQYGDLERYALALGFTLVPYEHLPDAAPDPMARMVARETGQARNIQQILTKDPKAKIVVHCGYGHLVENLVGDGQFGFMGAFLKKYTGLDPFTIHQVDLLEHADATLDNPYRALMHATGPSVFVDSQGALFNSAQNPEKWDASVYFPPTTYQHGRPTWLRLGNNRRYFTLKAPQLTVGFPCLVRAYRAGEDVTQAIPADVIELQSAGEDRALMLDKGRFTLLVQDAQGRQQQLAIEVR